MNVNVDVNSSAPHRTAPSVGYRRFSAVAHSCGARTCPDDARARRNDREQSLTDGAERGRVLRQRSSAGRHCVAAASVERVASARTVPTRSIVGRASVRA
jgi:hypothetical protein